MATEAELFTALRNAHDAGDEEAAQRFADMIRAQRGEKPQAATKEEAASEGLPRLKQNLRLLGKDVVEGTGAAIEGAGKAAFNIPGMVLGKDYEAAREKRLARNPGAAMAGELVGSAAGGAAAVKGAQLAARGLSAAIPAASPAIAKIGTALTPQTGQPLANTARYAATGAALGATQAATEGENPLAGAAAGGVGGAVLGNAPAIGGFIARRFSPSRAAMSALGRRIRAPGETLADATARATQAAADFQQVHGRMPAVAEIMGQRQAAATAESFAHSSKATEVAQAARDRYLKALPEEFSGALKGNRVTSSVPAVEAAQASKMNAAMGPIADTEINLPPGLNSRLRGIIAMDVKANADEAATNLLAQNKITLRTLDNVRQTLNKLNQSRPGHNYDTIRQQLVALGNAAEPRYGRALEAFGERGDVAAGIRQGQKVLGSGDTKEFKDAFENAGPNTQLGARVGARTAIVDTAHESPASAARTARRLAEDPGLRERVDTVLPYHEAPQVKQAGEVTTLGAQGMASITPSRAVPTDKAINDAVEELVRGAVLSSGRGSGGFIANFASNLGRMGKQPYGTAKKVAELATDHRNTPAVLQYLKRRGLSTPQILGIYRAAVAGQYAGGNAQ